MRRMLLVAVVAMTFVSVGCQNCCKKSDSKDAAAVKDQCPWCDGTQVANADGKCPKCGGKVEQ